MKLRIKLPNIRLPSLQTSYKILQELALLAGFLMVMRGLWMIYPPLMWIFGGLWLVLPGKRR